MIIQELVDHIYIGKDPSSINVYPKRDIYVRGYEDTHNVIIYLIDGNQPVVRIDADEDHQIIDSSGNVMVWNNYRELAYILANFAFLLPSYHNHANKPLLDSLTDGGVGDKYLADDGTYKEVTVNIDQSFLDLNDTPNDYTGMAGTILGVNATEDGLEFGTLTVDISWGQISGTLSNQADLQAELDAKENWLSNPSMDGMILYSDAAGHRYWDLPPAQQTVRWGDIEGTLSNQSDLQNALNHKADADHAHTVSDITDFEIEVANHVVVKANTAARHTHANKALLDSLDDNGPGDEFLSNDGTYKPFSGLTEFIQLLDTPLDYGGNAGKAVVVNVSEDGVVFGDIVGGGAEWGNITGTLANQTDLQDALDAKSNIGHSHLFKDLADTPGAYTGQQGRLVKVNATEDGLIFGDPSGTTVSWGDISGTLANQTDLQNALNAKADANHGHSFLDLSDTPGDYTGADGNILVVDESGAVLAYAELTTDIVAEGARLYFTDARVESNAVVVANTSARHSHANKGLLDSLLDNGDGTLFLANDGTYKSAGVGGSSTFTDLTDTPSGYSGMAGMIPVVNNTEDALEFLPPKNAKTWEVDYDNGDDVEGSGSSLYPFKTIQKALDVAANRNIIIVHSSPGHRYQINNTHGNTYYLIGSFSLFTEFEIADAQTGYLFFENCRIYGPVDCPNLSINITNGNWSYGVVAQQLVLVNSDLYVSDQDSFEVTDNAVFKFSNINSHNDTGFVNSGSSSRGFHINGSYVNVANGIHIQNTGSYLIEFKNSTVNGDVNVQGDLSIWNTVITGTVVVSGAYIIRNQVSGGVNNFIELIDTPADYSGQQGKLVKVNATEDGLIFGDPSGMTVSWGDITGTLANQTDLQNALNAKADSDHSHVITDVSGLQDSLDGKVNRSGDTMSGILDVIRDFTVGADDEYHFAIGQQAGDYKIGFLSGVSSGLPGLRIARINKSNGRINKNLFNIGVNVPFINFLDNGTLDIGGHVHWHEANAPGANIPIDTGDGTLFLANDGVYKEVNVSMANGRGTTVRDGNKIDLGGGDPVTSSIIELSQGNAEFRIEEPRLASTDSWVTKFMMKSDYGFQMVRRYGSDAGGKYGFLLDCWRDTNANMDALDLLAANFVEGNLAAVRVGLDGRVYFGDVWTVGATSAFKGIKYWADYASIDWAADNMLIPHQKRVQEMIDAGVGGGTFAGLTDTPGDYSGHKGKMVKVNDAEDALIFDQITASLNNFYVNGNNPNTGDGSVLDPFQTIQQAKNAVIGSGTAESPEFENSAIIVYGSVYSVNENLWISNVSYHLFSDVVIDYTGSDYLFDSSIIAQPTTEKHVCGIYGDGTIKTATGGLFNVLGSETAVSGGIGIGMVIVVHYLESTFEGTTVSDRPILKMGNKDSGINDYRENVNITFNTIRSLYQVPIQIYNKGSLKAYGGYISAGPSSSGTHNDIRVMIVNNPLKLYMVNTIMSAFYGDTMVDIDGESTMLSFDNVKMIGGLGSTDGGVGSFITFGSSFASGNNGWSGATPQFRFNVNYDGGLLLNKNISWIEADPAADLSELYVDKCSFRQICDVDLSRFNLVGVSSWYESETDTELSNYPEIKPEFSETGIPFLQGFMPSGTALERNRWSDADDIDKNSVMLCEQGSVANLPDSDRAWIIWTYRYNETHFQQYAFAFADGTFPDSKIYGRRNDGAWSEVGGTTVLDNANLSILPTKAEARELNLTEGQSAIVRSQTGKVYNVVKIGDEWFFNIMKKINR